MAQKKAKLGQNFLIDQHASQRIVDALGDLTQGTTIEIGPGRGAITALLAKKAKHLIAIEYDRMLAAQLRMDFNRAANVEIIDANILYVDFDTLVQGTLQGVANARGPESVRKAKVVGNLPYYITSDILLKLFECHENFDAIVIMVQREVADRVAAKPGSRDYGLLTVTAQLYCEVENLFTLPPTAFSPKPKVHSSVLRMRIAPRIASLGVEAGGFMRFLKSSFSQKRKTLANNLKPVYDPKLVAGAMAAAKVKPDARAEALSLEKLAAIFSHLAAGQ